MSIFNQFVGQYILALDGLVDAQGAETRQQYEARIEAVVEELLADAYAGMNMWNAGASQFTETVREFMEENNISRKPGSENGLRDTYAQEGHPLADDAAVDKEIVADYVARNLLRNEQSIVSLVNENPSLGRKILNWIDKLLAKLGNEDAQARVFLTDARRIYANALGQSHAMAAQTQAEPQTVGEAMTRQIRTNHGLEPEATAGVNEAAEEAPLRGLELPKLEEETPAATEAGGAEDQRQVWAEMYSTGQITEEEYDSLLEALEEWELEQEAAGEVQHSISEIRGKNNNYGTGVLLDTDIFDGIRPHAWGEVLGDFVYNNLAGTEMTVYDENGIPETIFLAKATDRVRKDGAKNSHKVLDKLAGYRGNQVRAKAIVQLSEVLQSSRYEDTTDEHSHQWLDENGWTIRKVYLETLDGDIYEATLNIANGRDRKTLYEINRVHWIDKKETSASIPSTDNRQRSRYQEHGMGGTQSEVTKESLANNIPSVKEQFSISKVAERDAEYEDAVARGDMATAQKLVYPPVKREELKGKAKKGLEDAERNLLNQLGYKLGVSRMARREDLLPVLREISDAYLGNDTVSNEKVEELFDKAYEAGRVIDRMQDVFCLRNKLRNADKFL